MSGVEKFILLAEDDPVVAELVLHLFGQQDPAPTVVHVQDGVEALDFLHSHGAYEHREPGNPAVVILDVKMPRLDGLEVLRHIKSEEHLRATPVVMLTSSYDDRDIRTAYDHGANAYVVKPVEFPRFAEFIRSLPFFWMEVNQPPSQPVHVPGVMAQ
jgi:two-component system response regulator